MIRIIKKSELQTSYWAGGTTTELFIYPEFAIYKKMDFDFRISTATIEIDTSIFSTLKDVQRTLMVLDGTLELTHKDHHTAILKPFEIDSFGGEWQTTSRGKAVDFNLMLRDSNLSGRVKAITIRRKSSNTFDTGKHGIIYFYKGDVAYNNGTELSVGDTVYFNSDDSVTILAKSTVKIVFVTIQ